jgi:phosphatidylglycerophosphatase C
VNQNLNTSGEDTRPVAFFDFDGTLTIGDTLMPFLKYVVGGPTYYAKLALLSPVLAAYFSKLLRNDIAKQIVLKQYLAGYHIDEIFQLGKSFSEEVIPTMLRPEGMKWLRWHQEQGHECVLVSASLDVYLTYWANNEKLTDVLCTSLEQSEEGRVTGRIGGVNCHGKEKLNRICGWQACRNPVKIYAYGDTLSDIPMIASASFGYMWKKNKRQFVTF